MKKVKKDILQYWESVWDLMKSLSGMGAVGLLRFTPDGYSKSLLEIFDKLDVGQFVWSAIKERVLSAPDRS